MSEWVMVPSNMGKWIMVPPVPCSNCRFGLFFHRFLTKEDCEKAYAAWIKLINTWHLGEGLGWLNFTNIVAECAPSNPHPEKP